MINMDQLFSALNHGKNLIDKQKTKKDVIKESSSLYKYTFIDRYIFYIIQYVIYNIICNFFWIDKIIILYYGMFVNIFPSILNKILSSKWFNKIKLIKEKFIKIIIAKQIASLIKLFSKYYLNKPTVNVKHKDILPLLKNYDQAKGYFWDVLKNTLVALLLLYVKTCSTKFYYRLLKVFYKYKTGDALKSFNERAAKSMLIDIIDNKRWKDLLQPNVFRALFYLWQMNYGKSDFLNKVIADFNFKFLTMSSIWTVTAFFNVNFLSPFISLFITIYSKNIENVNLWEYVAHIIGFFIAGCGNTYLITFVTNFVCQFGSELLVNGVTKNIFKHVKRKTEKISKKIYIKNTEIMISLISTLIYAIIFKFFVNYESTLLILIHFCYMIMTKYSLKKSIIFGLIISSAYLSGFNVVHMISNSIIIYLVFGFVDHKLPDRLIIKLDQLLSQLPDSIKRAKIYLTKYYNKYIKKKTSEHILYYKSSAKINYDIFDLPEEMCIDAMTIDTDPNIDEPREDILEYSKTEEIKIIEDFY